jgi:hypothetical protein
MMDQFKGGEVEAYDRDLLGCKGNAWWQKGLLVRPFEA